MITKQRTPHERITNAMERCRNGHEIHIELPEQTVTIRCERDDIRHRFIIKYRNKEIGALAVWKLISNHEVRID
jgi:hypothetical protein